MNLNMNGKFPAILLTTLFLQTFIAIWWAASLTSKVDIQGEAIKELKSTVTALTSAKIVVLETEVARLQAELAIMKLSNQQKK